jgi:hypothetical protein
MRESGVLTQLAKTIRRALLSLVARRLERRLQEDANTIELPPSAWRRIKEGE